jgi:hypothetical protein
VLDSLVLPPTKHTKEQTLVVAVSEELALVDVCVLVAVVVVNVRVVVEVADAVLEWVETVAVLVAVVLVNVKVLVMEDRVVMV